MTDAKVVGLRGGPLTAEMVPLLTDRSVLRVILPPVFEDGRNEPPLDALVAVAGAIPYQTCVFLADHEPGYGWHMSRFEYVGDRSSDGWITAPVGGWESNPAPGRMVQTRDGHGVRLAVPSDMITASDWSGQGGLYSITAFRLTEAEAALPDASQPGTKSEGRSAPNILHPADTPANAGWSWEPLYRRALSATPTPKRASVVVPRATVAAWLNARKAFQSTDGGAVELRTLIHAEGALSSAVEAALAAAPAPSPSEGAVVGELVADCPFCAGPLISVERCADAACQAAIPELLEAWRRDHPIGEIVNGERCSIHGPIARYSDKCGACEQEAGR